MDVELNTVRHKFQEFVLSCASGTQDFRLSSQADASLYATCFAIYSLHLVNALDQIGDRELLARHLAAQLRLQRPSDPHVRHAKPFRQLLAFSLSALAILRALEKDPLADLVAEQIERDIEYALLRTGAMQGQAGSGNQAMFSAIFLLHARNFLGMDTQSLLNQWVEIHVRRMNRFGFWGPDTGMTHLQFQNGYHQHEVLEYLHVNNPRQIQTLAAVRGLSDPEGHFAPYPGGGGCYDYDAVFMLTPGGQVPDANTKTLLLRTAATLVSEQRQDGGFAESVRIRPRSLTNLRMLVSHTLDSLGEGPVFFERLRYGLTLLRPKHDRIRTHWSHYSRRWDESDLWDSWFRMLTLARIDVALHPEHAAHWGFIDYPGIGYHPSLRPKEQVE